VDNPGGKEKKAMVTKDNGKSSAIPTADLTALDAVIQQAVAQVKGVRQLLPEFAPAPAEGLRAMRSARAFTDEFLEASAVASEHDTTMQGVPSMFDS
jgi:hypothetical protein